MHGYYIGLAALTRYRLTAVISKLLTKGFHLCYEFASVNYRVIRGLVSGASVFFSPSTRWAEGQGPSAKKYLGASGQFTRRAQIRANKGFAENLVTHLPTRTEVSSSPLDV